MTSKERKQVRELIAKNKGNKLAGVAEFLGRDAGDAVRGMGENSKLKYPVGWDAAFHGILDEVERYADLDAAEDESAAAAAASDGKTTAQGSEGGNS